MRQKESSADVVVVVYFFTVDIILRLIFFKSTTLITTSLSRVLGTEINYIHKSITHTPDIGIHTRHTAIPIPAVNVYV